MKVRDLIYSTMRLAGVLASGETPPASEAQDALRSLNSMLGLWSNNGLLIYEITTESFDLVSGQQAYTIGVGGNFDTSRPSTILRAAIVENGFEYPVEILNYQQWAGIATKSTSSSIPTKLYLETSYPLAIVDLWPAPDVANQLKLYTLKPLAEFTDLEQTISLPPGYEEMIKYNHYLRLAPEYGKPVDQEIKMLAIEAKLEIEKQGARELLSSTGLTAFIPRSYSIYTGGN